LQHTPFFKECKDSDTLVVFIHGFMGCPGYFSEFAEAVYAQGYSVAALLLPGHGGAHKEFIKAGCQDWEGHVGRAMARFRERYRRVFLVGHSMGGLLALNASLETESHVQGVFLIACPALTPGASLRMLSARLLRMVLPKRHKLNRAYAQAYGLRGKCSLGGSFGKVRPMYEFCKLQKKAKANLSKVTIPVVIVQSLRDETVPSKNAALLKRGLGQAWSKVIMLKWSWHSYYEEEEKQIVSDELLSFISGECLQESLLSSHSAN